MLKRVVMLLLVCMSALPVSAHEHFDKYPALCNFTGAYNDALMPMENFDKKIGPGRSAVLLGKCGDKPSIIEIMRYYPYPKPQENGAVASKLVYFGYIKKNAHQPEDHGYVEIFQAQSHDLDKDGNYLNTQKVEVDKQEWEFALIDYKLCITVFNSPTNNMGASAVDNMEFLRTGYNPKYHENLERAVRDEK